MTSFGRRYPFVRVSDHALLRFLERAGGCDLERLRCQLEESLKRAVSAASDIGGGNFSVRADGLTYIVRNNVVVTILTDKHKRTDSTEAQS